MFEHRAAPERSSTGLRAVSAREPVVAIVLEVEGELSSEHLEEAEHHDLPARLTEPRKATIAARQLGEISSVPPVTRLVQPTAPRCKPLAGKALPKADNAVTVSTHDARRLSRNLNRIYNA
jgi:hypothetical protein